MYQHPEEQERRPANRTCCEFARGTGGHAQPEPAVKAQVADWSKPRCARSATTRCSATTPATWSASCSDGRRSPTVLLNCHMDTAHPPATRLDATRLQRRGTDGRLYGVGAADCKGGLAAQVFAGALLKRSLLPLRGQPGRRGHGGRGKRLQRRRPARCSSRRCRNWTCNPTYAILGEPTDLGLYYGHDGWDGDGHPRGRRRTRSRWTMPPRRSFNDLKASGDHAIGRTSGTPDVSRFSGRASRTDGGFRRRPSRSTRRLAARRGRRPGHVTRSSTRRRAGRRNPAARWRWRWRCARRRQQLYNGRTHAGQQVDPRLDAPIRSIR